jgi:hypothetical protein
MAVGLLTAVAMTAPDGGRPMPERQHSSTQYTAKATIHPPNASSGRVVVLANGIVNHG